MTEQQITTHIRNRTPLFEVMSVLSGEIGRIEQANAQRRISTTLQNIDMMFDAVNCILDKAKEVGLVS